MERKPKIEELKAVKTPVYDPRKNYEWAEDDIFSVTGKEIDFWYKAMSAIVASDDYQRFLFIQRGAAAMQNFLKESVEQGLISEVKKEEPKKQEDGPTQSSTE